MKKQIISVGNPGFPLGFAQVQRQTLLAKALLLDGYEVTVLCRYGVHLPSDGIHKEGVFENIRYKYCSGSALRPDNYLKRNLLKTIGLLNEAIYIWRMKRQNHIAGVLISTNHFYNILFYWIICRIVRTKIVVDNVEYWTAHNNYTGLMRIDKILYDKYYFLFADKIICISDLLLDKVWESKRGKTIKIPAITDYDKFKVNKNYSNAKENKYMLFCGSEYYYEIICFIIRTFEKAKTNDVKLIIISNCTEKLKRRILASNKNNAIQVLSNIQYDDLVQLYLQSEALLIPMRNNDQDKARFPHKISEYCAARRPIITNAIGEVKNYFNDTNAIMCIDYDEEQYACAMENIISNPAYGSKVSLNSYSMGNINFNYKSYSKLLSQLF